MTTWSALLGDEERADEEAAEPGFFGRLRDSLGKSRRALTGQLAAAAFDPSDDEAWERLEEALIAADVGVPATAPFTQTTLCPLGPSVVSPLASLDKYFRDEIIARINSDAGVKV